LGLTEEIFASIVKGGIANGGPQIAILNTGLVVAFDHIGKSYQFQPGLDVITEGDIDGR